MVTTVIIFTFLGLCLGMMLAAGLIWYDNRKLFTKMLKDGYSSAKALETIGLRLIGR